MGVVYTRPGRREVRLYGPLTVTALDIQKAAATRHKHLGYVTTPFKMVLEMNK